MKNEATLTTLVEVLRDDLSVLSLPPGSVVKLYPEDIDQEEGILAQYGSYYFFRIHRDEFICTL